MKKNMGTADRVIRLLIAILFVVLFFTNVISGTTGIILLVLAAVFVLTSIFSICPFYMLLKISTLKEKKE